jgi:hypothetical protein
VYREGLSSTDDDIRQAADAVEEPGLATDADGPADQSEAAAEKLPHPDRIVSVVRDPALGGSVVRTKVGKIQRRSVVRIIRSANGYYVRVRTKEGHARRMGPFATREAALREADAMTKAKVKRGTATRRPPG